MNKNDKIDFEEKGFEKTDTLSFHDFIFKLKDTITSNLRIYQDYDSTQDKSNQVVVINKMNELKELNNEYLKRITKMKSEIALENNNMLFEITQELKAKQRLQFSALFYFSFYTFGATIISNHYGHSIPTRLGFLAFLYIPNFIFYIKKFKSSNAKVQEILLNHTISKGIIVKDKEIVTKFIKNYLNFCTKNKLI